MEVSSINSLKGVSQNFGTHQTSAQQSDGKAKQVDSNKVWKYLGALGVAVAAGIGIYAVTKKMHTISLADCLDLAAFKKLGKFDKGKAIYNGSPFTGTISTGTHKISYLGGELYRSENLKTGLQKIYNYAVKYIDPLTKKQGVMSNLTMIQDKSGKLLKVLDTKSKAIMDLEKATITSIKDGKAVTRKCTCWDSLYDSFKELSNRMSKQV